MDEKYFENKADYLKKCFECDPSIKHVYYRDEIHRVLHQIYLDGCKAQLEECREAVKKMPDNGTSNCGQSLISILAALDAAAIKEKA